MSAEEPSQRAAEFDAFYQGTNRRVLHQMYAMTGNLADAQELVQEAYARAWQRWSSVSTYDDPEAWVRTVAWRLAASRWRKAKNGVAAMLRHGPPEDTPEPSIDNVALVAALRQIPEAQRRAIVLHHLGRPLRRRGRPRDGRPRRARSRHASRVAGPRSPSSCPTRRSRR